MGSKVEIVEMTRERFDALTFSRRPLVTLFLQQKEWYSDKSEKVIATIALDKIDRDWSFVLLGRDENGLFRAIDTGINFKYIHQARRSMSRKIINLINSGQSVFSQGDYKRKKNKIFDLVVATDKQHPTFVRLANEIGFSPAKEIIKEIVYAFEDPDGNYIEQFQSSGFDARLWELCIYAYLHEENFEIPRLHNAPDYMCEKFGETVFIEAVTVNPSSKIDEAPPQTEEEARQRSLNYMPIKYGSALYSKLQKRYWKLPQVKEWPLILAIHDFHQVQSILWSHASLPLYLYGYSQTTSRGPNGELIITPQKVERHEYKGKVIPSGFFFLPEAENISAVLFSNSATISKFNRMGKLAGFGDPRVKMIRRGYIHDPNPDADMPLGFSVEVERSKYDEFWADGFSMYHNPVAVHPVNPRLFPSITHHYFRDGQIESHLTDIFIHSSVTIITLDE